MLVFPSQFLPVLSYLRMWYHYLILHGVLQLCSLMYPYSDQVTSSIYSRASWVSSPEASWYPPNSSPFFYAFPCTIHSLQSRLVMSWNINYVTLDLSNGFLLPSNKITSNILSTMREAQFQSLDWEDLLEKETATHSSILAWKTPLMEEPGELQSMGSQRVGHDWVTSLSISVHVCSVVSNSSQPHGLWPTKLFCPWNVPGKNIGVGCHFLLQGIFPTQGSNPSLSCLLNRQADSLPTHHLGSAPSLALDQTCLLWFLHRCWRTEISFNLLLLVWSISSH